MTEGLEGRGMGWAGYMQELCHTEDRKYLSRGTNTSTWTTTTTNKRSTRLTMAAASGCLFRKPVRRKAARIAPRRSELSMEHKRRSKRQANKLTFPTTHKYTNGHHGNGTA